MPKEFNVMTYYDYTLLCIGNKDKKLNEQRRDRQLQWIIISQYKDPKKPPFKMEDWWPIEGDKIIEFAPPSNERLKELDNQFRSLGRNKNG